MTDQTSRAGPRATSPYLLTDPPVSAGRVLLAAGFAHYCALQWGMGGEDVAAAFASQGRQTHDALRVGGAANLVGELFARSVLRAWVRPFGGGEPAPLRAQSWELDDFADRFAASALDPARPFDVGATPTHWIFVDRDEWNELLEASVADTAAALRAAIRAKSAPSAANAAHSVSQDAAERGSGSDDGRLIRLSEVMGRTGLSRSTIYRKMANGTFPANEPVAGSRPLWRESAVADWMASPR